jgi:hypothetical protein
LGVGVGEDRLIVILSDLCAGAGAVGGGRASSMGSSVNALYGAALQQTVSVVLFVKCKMFMHCSL